MKNTYFTSDWHLEHQKIQEYCPYSRKGSDPVEMSTIIVDQICDMMKPGDDLFNLGDVSFATVERTAFYLDKIKKAGINHHLIFGNHDHRIRKELSLHQYFASMQDDLDLTFAKKTYIVMNHFPKDSFHRQHHGAYHLHGHRHSTHQLHDGLRRMDVGVDSRAAGDMKPYHIDEIFAILKPVPYGTHH